MPEQSIEYGRPGKMSYKTTKWSRLPARLSVGKLFNGKMEAYLARIRRELACHDCNLQTYKQRLRKLCGHNCGVTTRLVSLAVFSDFSFLPRALFWVDAPPSSSELLEDSPRWSIWAKTLEVKVGSARRSLIITEGSRGPACSAGTALTWAGWLCKRAFRLCNVWRLEGKF